MRLEIRYPMLVFPVPGGPQKIIEGIRPHSINLRSGPFSPIRRVCPANSSSEVGRKSEESGSSIVVKKKVCPYYSENGAFVKRTRARNSIDTFDKTGFFCTYIPIIL